MVSQMRLEHRLRVFEKTKLKKIFGSKMDGVTGGRREVHYKKLHDVYSSTTDIHVVKSRRMKRAGQVPHMREGRRAYRVLMKKKKTERDCL